MRAAPMYNTVHPKAVMTLPATFVIDAPGDAQRAAELRRVKWLATSVLAATLLLFIAAKALLPLHPASATNCGAKPNPKPACPALSRNSRRLIRGIEDSKQNAH